MSLDENSSIDSNSSSSSCDFSFFDEWKERIAQENRYIDRLIEDWLISYLLPGDATIISPEQSPPRHCSSGGTTTGVGFSKMSSGSGDGRQLLEFPLSPSSFLKIQKGDRTQWSVDGSSDAIVNSANERMLGGGGGDGAIHRAAGPELRAACYEVPEVKPGVRCPTGEARITPGFRLPASHVIHTVGPIYDVDKNPEASLKNAYRNSLRVAEENYIQYIAFPGISCGSYGYPYDEAAAVAISTIKEFAGDIKEVHFVLSSDEIYDAWVGKANELLHK